MNKLITSLLLICTVSYGAVMARITSDKVETFDGFRLWGNRAIVDAPGSGIRMDAGHVYLNTSKYWIDGVLYTDTLGPDILQHLTGTTDGLNLVDLIAPPTYAAPSIVQRQVLSFDGEDRLEIGVLPDPVESISLDFYNSTEIDSTAYNGCLLSGQNDQSYWIRTGHSSGSIEDETLSILTTLSPLSINYIKDVIPAGAHSLSVDWDGTDWIFTVDGVERETFTLDSPSIISDWDFTVGNRRLTTGVWDQPFNGYIWNVNIGDGDAVLPLEGSTYDVSGNGNHGTLEGGTWVDAEIPSNPIGEAAPTIVGRQVYTLGGVVGDHMVIPIGGVTQENALGACTISGWVRIDSHAASTCLFAYGNSAYRLFYAASTDNFRLNSNLVLPFAIPPAGEWFHFMAEFNEAGEGISAQIGDEAPWTGVAPAGVASVSVGLILGERYSSGYGQSLNGALANVSVAATTYPEFTTHLPLEGSTYDVSGNGNHGTLEGGTFSPSDGVASYLAEHGFGAGNVPALLDGTTAADGSPITNPGGMVHNGGPYSIAYGAGITNTFAELTALTNSTSIDLVLNENGLVEELILYEE